ncbi:CDP-alcohol phosphatidyltransferase family protein [Candidatus Binatia bacterium]|nr:CDP-alcohol phosphatidyltransferase family protein [Candidatus Binatia bacterium]
MSPASNLPASALTLANALTALRVALTPVFVFLVVGDAEAWWGGLAVPVFALVAASDVVDGRLARRAGTASRAGRVFDHLADIGFLVSALGAYVALGVAPWWVPGAMATAFGTYVAATWLARSPRTPRRGAWVGHLGGIANFAVVGVLVCNYTAGLHWLGDTVMQVVFALVPAYSGLAAAASVSALVMPAADPDAYVSVE